MQKKKDYEAFLNGYKPGLLIESDSQHFVKFQSYPFVVTDHRSDYDIYLYFQTEEKNKHIYHCVVMKKKNIMH